MTYLQTYKVVKLLPFLAEDRGTAGGQRGLFILRETRRRDEHVLP